MSSIDFLSISVHCVLKKAITFVEKCVSGSSSVVNIGVSIKSQGVEQFDIRFL